MAYGVGGQGRVEPDRERIAAERARIAEQRQQERAEKDIARGKSHAGAEGTGGYAGKSAAEMRSVSHASPSHGGMHTDWSKDPSYRDTGFRGPPVVDQKAIDEAKEVDWTKQNTKNAWSKGIDAWNSWHNTKNLEWAKKK